MTPMTVWERWLAGLEPRSEDEQAWFRELDAAPAGAAGPDRLECSRRPLRVRRSPSPAKEAP